MKSKYSFLLIALLWCLPVLSQVPVALAPPLHPKFTDNNGDVLAGGFLHTYAAGTTSDQPTYADSSGTILNTAIIPLDASGAPSSGSSQTGIWLANQSYKVCALNSSLVQQWCVDNVSGYLGILNLPNTWSFPQTFTSTITDTLTDNQMVFGAAGNTTTVDFPPPATNIAIHFPITADTMVGRATTDTLTNKTLTSPTITTPTITTPTVNGKAVTGTVTQVLYKSVTPITHTGDTAVDVVLTTPALPVLSTNSILRASVVVTSTVQGAGNSILNLFLGTANVGVLTIGGAGDCFLNGTISNQNSVSVQAAGIMSGCAASVVFAINPGAINTGVAQTMSVKITNANNSDSQTIKYVFVELL